jgi:hypothetical protein
MLSIRSLAVAIVLACMAPVFAQTAQPAIEKQMTPEQFKAAGLDKLSAGELANLNTWLGRTLETQTARAAADAKQQVVRENRGFLSFGSDEPIKGRITGQFDGFQKGRIYTLDSGQVWKQIDDAQLAGVRLTNPEVNIKPALMGDTWYMAVGRYHTRAQVKRIK